MSHYADYIAEHTHGQVIESERGFVTYVFRDEKTCYIQEIYTAPQYRRTDATRDIVDHIEYLAKSRGCTTLLGSVVPSAKGSTISLKVLLAYGFTLDSSTQDFILFRKDL